MEDKMYRLGSLTFSYSRYIVRIFTISPKLKGNEINKRHKDTQKVRGE